MANETAKPTAGPWMLQPIATEGEERGACFIIGANLGGLVGAALPWPTELDSGDFSRVEANARMLAAGPELVREARKVIAFFEQTGFSSGFLDGLRAAIAKATAS